RRTPEVFNQAALVCPRCSQVVAWGRFRVVPWFDPSETDYELTARCDGCWRSTVRETQERLLANIESARERLKFVNCIERLGVRGLDPSQAAELRAQAVRLLEAFAKGAILLPLPDESKPAPP
ncbi:MAG TPA: hypothetical protein VK454_11255, partial [Myxococcaceae bacterium]|nr:hypothetical protein [Myxococcaceae bacterium]